MKLAISNIAWNDADDDAIQTILADAGVGAIEVAPTKLWPHWQGASLQSARGKAGAFSARGFSIPALQSLLFERNDLSIFGEAATQDRLIEHLAFVAELASGLGARALVFGSPRSRDPGEMNADTARATAKDVFRSAGDRCAAVGTCLCIEPNPRAYHCAFLTSWRDVSDFVAEIDHPGIGLHLDTACIAMEQDDVVEAIKTCEGRIAHFHISEPHLADFESPVLDHASFGRALRAIDYRGYASIEMRASHAPAQSVRTAIAKVSQWYAS